MDYWIECVSIGAEECGAELTMDQIKCIAESVAGGHDNYGMAFGYDAIRGESDEAKELKKLKAEIEKKEAYMASTVPCKHCIDGTARDGWGRDRQCDYCGGSGRLKRTSF